jgi:lysozyme
MQASSPINLTQQLNRDEGCRLTCYLDTATPPNYTVGVGHKIGYDCGTITQAQSDAYLETDIQHTELQLGTALSWVADLELEDYPRYAALVNMGFNLGVAGLHTFTTFLGFMQAKEWPSAAYDMLGTKWAQQVHDRANRLAEQIQTGVMV